MFESTADADLDPGVQVVPEPEPAPDPPAGHSHGVTRVAVMPLAVPGRMTNRQVSEEFEQTAARVREEIEAALESDTRVADVIRPEKPPRMQSALTIQFFPLKFSQTDVASAPHGIPALRLDRTITFRVHVPIKNQPKWRGADDVPVEDYWVSWNGVLAYVHWRAGAQSVSDSGGHVALEVIGAAAASAGFRAEPELCALNCSHGFLHINIISKYDTVGKTEFTEFAPTFNGESYITPWAIERDPVSEMRRIFRATSRALEYYARARTYGYRISRLANLVGSDSAKLMRLEYLRSASPPWWRLRAIPHRWALRGSRRQRRQILASIWLAITTVESLLPAWRRLDQRFRTTLEDAGMDAFLPSLETHSRAIAAIDLALGKETLAYVGARRDGLLLAAATALGGAAGAIAAALTAALS